MKARITVFIFAALPCFSAFSQNKNKIGYDLQLGYQPGNVVDWKYATFKSYQAKIIPGFGIVYERAISKKSSIEFEIKYRISPNEYIIYVPGGGSSTVKVDFSGEEFFLSFPILFKYNTKILNLSLGPTFEYFVNWKQTASNYYIPSGQSSLPNYFFPDNWTVGLMFKISKSIIIGNKFILEPGIFYNPILSYKNDYFGLSVVIKYPF